MISLQGPLLLLYPCDQLHSRVGVLPVDGGHSGVEEDAHSALQPPAEEVQQAVESALQHGVTVLALSVVVHVVSEGSHRLRMRGKEQCDRPTLDKKLFKYYP